MNTLDTYCPTCRRHTWVDWRLMISNSIFRFLYILPPSSHLSLTHSLHNPTDVHCPIVLFRKDTVYNGTYYFIKVSTTYRLLIQFTFFILYLGWTMLTLLTEVKPLIDRVRSSFFDICLTKDTLVTNDVLRLSLESMMAYGMKKDLQSASWSWSHSVDGSYQAIDLSWEEKKKQLRIISVWHVSYHSLGGMIFTIPAFLPNSSMDSTNNLKSLNSSIVGVKIGMVPPFSY